MANRKSNLKRIFSFSVALALFITTVPCKNVMAADSGETKKYMVFTED